MRLIALHIYKWQVGKSLSLVSKIEDSYFQEDILDLRAYFDDLGDDSF